MSRRVDLLTDSLSFTGERRLIAVPDGKGGTYLTVINRVLWERKQRDRVLVTMRLDRDASLKLARVLRSR